MKTNRGFSLLELMFALVLLFVISGAVFQTITLSTERSSAEQTKLDMFQEAREFMDQMGRDLRLAGYPNARNYAAAVLANPEYNDHRVAAGIIKIASGELWFEADVDGKGTVSVIHYYLDTSTANHCPCLKRSQLDKVDGDPLTGQTDPSYELEVQGVTNTTIFTAYSNAVLQTLPLVFGTDGAKIATLDTIQAVLSLEAIAPDPKTHQKATTTLATSVRLNNCSMAASGRTGSCS